MLSISTVKEIDELIISFLDPPQVLTMSELNTYFNELTNPKCIEFNVAKNNVFNALRMNYEWIIQWHIRSEHINNKKGRIRYSSKVSRQFLKESFACANYSFTTFLLDKISETKYADISSVIQKITDDFSHIYNGKFDVNFLEYVEDHIQKKFGVKCADYLMSEMSVRNIIEKLINKLQYDTIFALVKRNMHLTILSEWIVMHLTNNPTIFVKLDNTFITSLFNMLNICLTADYYNHMIERSSVLKDNSTFFILVDKYGSYVHHLSLFNFVCQYSDNVSIAQWLMTNADQTGNTIRLDKKYDAGMYPFEIACVNHNLELAKWFCDLSETNSDKYGRIDIHRDDEYLFRHVCTSNITVRDTDIANFLIEIGETTSQGRIDIHAKGILFECIKKQKTRISEYLLKLGIESYGKFDLSHIKQDIVEQYRKNPKNSLFMIYDWICNLPSVYVDNIDFSNDNVYRSTSSSEEYY